LEQFSCRAVDLRKIDRSSRASGDQEYIPSGLDVGQRASDALAHQAFEPVACYGIANPAADRERKTALRSVIAALDQDQLVIVPRASTAAQLLDLVVPSESVLFAQHRLRSHDIG
jgi:hypothetical protein